MQMETIGFQDLLTERCKNVFSRQTTASRNGLT
jgi:hypothetical protein